MAYTDIDKPSDYFETVIYTGNGSTLNVGGLDFTQNFTWIKNRSDGTSHFLYDTIRGAGNNKDLRSNSDGAEGSGDGATHGFMSAFRSDGFTVTQGSGTASITNASGNSYASWNWKAGTSFTNDASATGIGTIDSAGSVSTDAGFSIISYTGTGSAATVAHGLGSAPRMIIIKDRSNSRNWGVYHQSMGNLDAIYLDLTNEKGGNSSAFWNSTSPTSSVFSINTRNEVNASSANYVAYCFAEKQGYSKFGSYQGNSSNDGTYIHLGFSPAFFLFKNSSSAGSWVLVDAKRPGFNVINDSLNTNNSNAENTATVCDFTSNGVKFRTNADHMNGGYTFIYMAFAENPFVTSTGVPATAR